VPSGSRGFPSGNAWSIAAFHHACIRSRDLTQLPTSTNATTTPTAAAPAAEAAGLVEDVQGFPLGWDTVVGERGLTLSGGQRQRVALARALVGNPPYLVLDDVLASVDAGKEWEILRSLRGAVSGRTTLLMTHRLRAAQEADWVVVLDEGRVVEEGRHAELLASGGLYARLWRVQQLEDELARA